MPPQYLAGTSGYSYKEWVGSFYPKGLKSSEMLDYYGAQLPAVEINNTFYKMPRQEILRGWLEQVPSHFQFVIKAPRRITHMGRLNENTRDPTRHLMDTCSALEAHLGAVLFQLPPNFRCDIERLERFVDELPQGFRFAFEFRHDSWGCQQTLDVLSEHGMAWCMASENSDPKKTSWISTAPFGYLRLRAEHYTPQQLQSWKALIDDTQWERAYVFFKHEVKGPEFAQTLLGPTD